MLLMVGEEDDSNDGEGLKQVVADTQDTQIADEMEDSQSSASSNRVTMPPPLTTCRRPTPGKRMYYGPKRDVIEEKLLQIIKKPEKEPDEDEMFCLSLAATLEENPRPSKEGLYKLQLQQTLYNCMYGSVVNSQPNVGQTQPQPQQVQVPMCMSNINKTIITL